MVGSSSAALNVWFAGTCTAPLWESLQRHPSLLIQRELGCQHGQRHPAATSDVPLPSCGGGVATELDSSADSSVTLSLECRKHADWCSFWNIPHAALPFRHCVNTPIGSVQWKVEGSGFKGCFLDHLRQNPHEGLLESQSPGPTQT